MLLLMNKCSLYRKFYLIHLILILSVLQPGWSDYLELTNGDHISGTIVSMNETTVKLKTSYGNIDIPRKEIVSGQFGDAVVKNTAAAKTETAETRKKTSNTTTAVVPAEGIVVEYLFDGILRDTSGNNHAIKKMNNVFFGNGFTDKTNTAVVSDGIGAYLEVENSSRLENLDSLTLSCWFYIQAEAGNQYLISKWEKTTGQKAEGKFALSYSNKNIYYYIVDENGFFQGLKQEVSITQQKWYHLAATYSKGKLKLYLNGENIAEKQLTAKGLYKEKSPVYLMSAKSFTPEGWAYYNLKGRLDNVRIYNRELPLNEIRLLYLEGAAE